MEQDRPRIEVRAAGVIASGALVLLHRRIGEAVWALPGGHVEPGESAAQALTRELTEELGKPSQVGKLLFVVEDHFVHNGVRRHEVGLYFHAELPSLSLEAAAATPFAGEEATLEFCWFNRAELQQIELRPSFLAPVLAKPSVEFVHVTVGLPSTEV